MMGTIWLRLRSSQNNMQPYFNAIFFSGVFMSFMSVSLYSCLPGRLPLNVLYGPTGFVVSNFIIGLPFLFLFDIDVLDHHLFLGQLPVSANGFFLYVMWLFLDLVAAESMVVLISSMVPLFVAL
jgi:hypothetical protein